MGGAETFLLNICYYTVLPPSCWPLDLPNTMGGEGGNPNTDDGLLIDGMISKLSLLGFLLNSQLQI